MEYIIVFLAGWFLGRIALKFKLIKEALKSMNQRELKQLMGPKAPEVTPLFHTELVDGMMRLYDTASSTYMCKGDTIEEVASNLQSFYHIDTARITHNEQQYLVIDGKVA